MFTMKFKFLFNKINKPPLGRPCDLSFTALTDYNSKLFKKFGILDLSPMFQVSEKQRMPYFVKKFCV